MLKLILCAFLFFASNMVLSQPIKILVGFPPGGGQDIIARIVSDYLNKEGISSVVINKPGANGMIALNECEQDSEYLCVVADTQLVSSISMPENVHKFVYEKINYVKPIGVSPIVLVTKSNNKTYNEMIKEIQTTKVSFASGTNGLHNESLKFIKVLNAKNAVSIEYKGVGPAVIDIVGEHIQYGFIPYAVAKNNPSLKIVAVSRKHPYPELKDFPVLENEYKNLNLNDGVFGFVTSSKTSITTKNHYVNLVTQAMKSSYVKEKLSNNGVFLVDIKISDQEYKKLMDQTRTLYSEFLKTINQ